MSYRGLTTTDSSASSTAGSVFTYATGSMVWGPGALTGKLLKAVGEIGLDVIVNGIIHRRLSNIKNTLKKYPEIFLDPHAEDLQYILLDLHELRNDYYPQGIRRIAELLLEDVAACQALALIRHSLNSRMEYFIQPRDPEETQKMFEISTMLEDFSGERHSKCIRNAATELIRIIWDRFLGAETNENPVQHTITFSDFIERHKDTLAQIRRLNEARINRLPTGSTNNQLQVYVFTETVTVTMSDIQIGRMSEFRESNVQAYAMAVEMNGMREYDI